MRMRGQELLFTDGTIFDLLRHLDGLVKKKIDELPEKTILNVGNNTLVKALEDEFKLTVPSILKESISVTDKEIDQSFEDYGETIHRKGILITFHVPFEGDGELFKYQPSSFTFNPPRAEIRGNELQISFSPAHQDTDGQRTKDEFHRELSSIRQYLNSMTTQVAEFNTKLPEVALSSIEKRKQKLLKDRGIVSSLGYPIRSRGDQAMTYAAPVKRKVLSITLPATIPPFEPEPVLENSHYEHILNVSTQMSQVMERCPSAFKSIGEEDLRQHFLVQLNGHYEGQATGETFNYQGKTDILIRVNGKNIFIAECKFWTGEKAFQDTIDQLLSYSSWRDSKAAIFLFNRNRDFSKVLEKIPPSALRHPLFLRELPCAHQNGSRYVFSNKDDKLKEITLTVLGFDIPQ